jgi:ribosomal protein S18 acetylase RimI-like enzyme
MRLRRPALADAPALLALTVADEMHAIGRATLTRAEVEEMLVPAHTSISEDQWVVLDADDAIVGWGLVWDQGNTDHQDVDVYRDPSRASERVREALLDVLVARLGERARESGYARIDVYAGTYAEDTAYAATLRSRGFVFTRTFHRLQMPLPADVPLASPGLDGAAVTPFDFTDHGWRRFHQVVQESFVDHFGFVSVAYDDYRADAQAESSPDHEFWRVATVDGDIVGVVKASGRSAELSIGYVAELAVLPAYRGRGIARALLLDTFEAYRRAGRRRGELTVDTENTTGALRLYTSIGMRTDIEIRAYTRDVLPGPSSRS